jgi:hypothetical protein
MAFWRPPFSPPTRTPRGAGTASIAIVSKVICTCVSLLCQDRDEGGGGGAEPWRWEREDLHVHFARGDWEDMSMGLYTAVVATAMVSFFTGR